MNEDFQQKRATDKGWAAMRSLLDQEMPTQQKRRRFLIWWWLALLLSPLAIYGVVQWQHAPVPETTPGMDTRVPPGKPAPMAQIQAGTTVSGVQADLKNTAPSGKNSKEVGAGVTPSASAGTPRSHSNSGTKSAAKSVAVGTQSPQKKTLENPVSLVNSKALPEITDAVVSGQTAPFGVTMSITTLDIRSVQMSTAIDNNVHGVTSPVPDRGAGKTDKNTQPQKHAAKWQLGGSAFAATEKFNAVNSLGGGLTVQRSITSHWGIRSGLHYSRNTTGQGAVLIPTTEFLSAVDSTSYLVTDMLGNIIAPLTPSGSVVLDDAIVVPVSRIHSLEVPVLASWRASKTVSFYAGLNTAYLLKTQTGGESYSGDVTLKSNSRYSDQSLGALVTTAIDRWRFDGQAGLGLHLGQHFELGFFAKLPLNATSKQQVLASQYLENQFNNGFPSDLKELGKRSASFSLLATYFF